MKKTFFKESYQDLIQAKIYMSGLEYAYDPLSVEYGLVNGNQEELAVYKKVNNLYQDKEKNKDRINQLDPMEIEVYNRYKNDVLRINTYDFQGKDQYNKVLREGKELIAHQERKATGTKFIIQEKPFEYDKFNRPVEDPYVPGYHKISDNMNKQNVNLKVVAPEEQVTYIKTRIRMLSDAGLVEVDFKNGYLNPISDKVNTIFAEILVLKQNGKVVEEIPLQISKVNENNKAMGYIEYDKIVDFPNPLAKEKIVHSPNQNTQPQEVKKEQPKEEKK